MIYPEMKTRIANSLPWSAREIIAAPKGGMWSKEEKVSDRERYMDIWREIERDIYETETTHRGRMNSYYSWKNLGGFRGGQGMGEVRYRPSWSSMCEV